MPFIRFDVQKITYNFKFTLQNPKFLKNGQKAQRSNAPSYLIYVAKRPMIEHFHWHHVKAHRILCRFQENGRFYIMHLFPLKIGKKASDIHFMSHNFLFLFLNRSYVMRLVSLSVGVSQLWPKNCPKGFLSYCPMMENIFLRKLTKL